ncbi:hypothetical protein CVT25_008170 [Psilocybe cyanescens]|uniref:Uncharacterized protein n=1 Tax=Psilocybe cyanescens TaxID=93625 RepID=A0A409XGB9_PSICY|nr:hypothetical protein CVT25_008170 [Psilocybe cyanescens]
MVGRQDDSTTRVQVQEVVVTKIQGQSPWLLLSGKMDECPKFVMDFSHSFVETSGAFSTASGDGFKRRPSSKPFAYRSFNAQMVDAFPETETEVMT